MIIIFCSAATEAAAFPSCCRPSTALNSVSATRTMPVSHSFSARLTTPATSRTICIKSAYWRRNTRHRGSAVPISNLFKPNRSAREATSAELRPYCSSTFSARKTPSALSVCHTCPSPGARPGAAAPV